MLSNYAKTLIHQMAKSTGTNLTGVHMRVLDFAAAYYEKNRVGPLYTNLERFTGVTRGELDSLFPHGLTSVYNWVGIPIQSTDDLCKPMAEVSVEDFRNVYFDYNATTFVRKEVRQALVNYYEKESELGNPSSSTRLGKKAFDAINRARGQVAGCLSVKPAEITFTGSGSEANNMAIKGVAFRHMDTPQKGHIITTGVEHASVIESVHFLGMLGFSVTFLDVDAGGRISVDAVKRAFRSDTILVSVMAANNEIGTINPIAEIGELCRLAEVPFMVDAIQAFGKVPLKPKEMGISLMSVSGHKVYAPKGIGALYMDESLSLVPLIHGGSQEFGRRAGTENLGHIIAFGKAAELSCREMRAEMPRLAALRDHFLSRLSATVPDHIINGSMDHRLPVNLSVGFDGVDSGALLLSLNRIGVYVSSGSACSAGSKEASPVIQALGVDTERYGTIRFSFGLDSTQEEVDYLFTYLPDIIEKLRAQP